MKVLTMAKLKYNKTIYKLRRVPELPDWYRYLQIFIGVIIAVVILVNLISPSSSKPKLITLADSEISSNSENYTPSPIVNQETVISNNSPTGTSSVETLSGEKVEIENSKLKLAQQVALASFSGKWEGVKFTQGDTVASKPTGLSPKIGKIYLVDSTPSEVSLLIVVIKDPKQNGKVGVQITVNLILENGNWVYSPSSNSGL